MSEYTEPGNIFQNTLNQVLYFDAIAPAEEIPNHLLLLYLTTGESFSKLKMKIIKFNKDIQSPHNNR